MPKTGLDKWRELHYSPWDSTQALVGLALATGGAYQLWGLWAAAFTFGLLAKVDIWLDGITLAIAKDKS
jgi:hypothetical protein